MNYKLIIGKNIKHYRELMGWNQTTLGMLSLDYTDSTRTAGQTKIAKIELGKIDITIEEIVKIAHTLNVPISALIGDSPDNDNLPQPAPPNPLLAEKCGKVKVILESKTTYAGALKENIDAFHEAVNAVAKQQESEREIAALRAEVKDLARITKELQKRDSADHLTATGPPSQLRKKRGTSSSG